MKTNTEHKSIDLLSKYEFHMILHLDMLQDKAQYFKNTAAKISAHNNVFIRYFSKNCEQIFLSSIFY